MSTFKYFPAAEESGGELNEMELRLWDYIDGNSSDEEKGFVEKLIATNLEWKAKHKELLDVNQLIAGNLELDAPSMRFTKNVMEEIGKYQIAPAAKSYINKKIIWGIAIFFFTMIAGFLIYGFGTIDWSLAPSSTTQSLIPDVPKVQWNKFFNNTYTNIFLMVNVVLGLMLFDMYLTRKKKQIQEKSSH